MFMQILCYNNYMKIKMLYFAEAKDVVKKDQEDIDFNGNTISELRETLLKKYPEITYVLSSSVFAVNMKYVGNDAVLKDNDTVAIIPPVEGG